jgi:1,4-dihydroxy-2-naphthoyl-CoA hydrolase
MTIVAGQNILWREGVTTERLNEFSRNTMVEMLGIRISEIGTNFLRGTMPVNERSCQPMRILHGGASVAFAETLASIAANCCVAETFVAVGQEINANHLRPVPEGETVEGIARLVHAGARSQVWSIELRNGKGQLTCLSRITLAIIKRR